MVPQLPPVPGGVDDDDGLELDDDGDDDHDLELDNGGATTTAWTMARPPHSQGTDLIRSSTGATNDHLSRQPAAVRSRPGARTRSAGDRRAGHLKACRRRAFASR
ncbi:hypothetical protein [Arthrobacter sp. H20]|uniref:hypothetical protein n=1 Tax=Arthrobacter sp. H20 TaxID=1267981 RepID=UPI0012DC126A|nr:hypothetical protein [Arthrobacter sp. H20]